MPLLPIKKRGKDCPVRPGSLLENQAGPHHLEASCPKEILHQLGYSQVGEDVKENFEIATLLVNLDNDSRPFAKVELMGISVVGLLDSGASKTILGIGSRKLIKMLKLKIIPTNIKLSTAGGQHLEVIGAVDIPVTFNGVTRLLSILVAPDLNRRCILGYDFWRKFGIRPTLQESVESLDGEAGTNLEEDEERLSDDQKRQLDDVKKMFLVAGPGKFGETKLLEHRIELKDEFIHSEPVRKNPYPWSPEIQRKIHLAVDKMLAEDIIEPSESDWSLPIVPVSKRDSDEVRLCLDARKLNERTKRDAYPLPHQNRILSHLGKFKYLSTIDLSQAFLQIPLHPDSRKFTAFSVPGRGLFHFRRLAYGLANSPASLSKVMDRTLGHGALEPYIFVYLDDIVVVSATFEDHILKLRELASRLRKANLFINIKKSNFCCHELPYLGYILSREGLRPNPDRIQAILGFEVPNSVRSLRRFLGMANYYRRFISNFSELTAPLTDLLKNKPKKVQWNDAAEGAFQAIKERLITAPVMANPDFSKPFCVQTDASDTALAGVLTQVQGGLERVIAFHSEKLKGAELNYHAAEKEGLAALRCIEKFRCYIEGTHFTLITDSSALSFIMRAKWKSSSRLSRWSITLQQYDMDVKHRKGKENVVPDALSRSIESLEPVPEDEWYRNLYQAVQQDPEKYIDFRIESRKLYKLVASKSDVLDYTFAWKECVPKSQRNRVMQQEHDEKLHIGYEKCIEYLKRRFYWPRMSADLKRYLAQCDACKENKHPTHSTVPEMGKQRIATRPFQIVCMDYIQSLPRSKQGNAHLLVVLDLFSKYCLLVPVKKIASGSLCTILEEQWFRKLSVPQIIISDNASTFLSKEFQGLLQKYEVQHWANARHRSQANPAERLNRTINSMIRSYVRIDQRMWDCRISEVEHVLNNTIHATTKFTPHRIVFGNEIITRGADYVLETEPTLTEDERVLKFKNINRKVWEIVCENLRTAHESTKKRYDLRQKTYTPTFNVGQRVFKKSFKQSSAANDFNAKLGPVYVPCKILAKKGTSSYEVADMEGRSLGIFSASDLRV